MTRLRIGKRPCTPIAKVTSFKTWNLVLKRTIGQNRNIDHHSEGNEGAHVTRRIQTPIVDLPGVNYVRNLWKILSQGVRFGRTGSNILTGHQ